MSTKAQRMVELFRDTYFKLYKILPVDERIYYISDFYFDIEFMKECLKLKVPTNIMIDYYYYICEYYSNELQEIPPIKLEAYLKERK